MKYFLLICLNFLILGQCKLQNCNAFLYNGDTLKYEACTIAERSSRHYQFSRAYQEIYDRALEKCNYYAPAYRSKSTAYLKSGDFISWKQLMDEAVRLDPKEHLAYRGWCRYQFFRDYEGAIADIERLDSLINFDIGHSVNGDYHLNIARGLCYKALGNNSKAMEIIHKQLDQGDHFVGIYDYLHLGVLYLEEMKFDSALHYLLLQEDENNIAECQFYLAQVFIQNGNQTQARRRLEKSRTLYIEDRKMFDPYTAPYDKIYLSQIESELATILDSEIEH